VNRPRWVTALHVGIIAALVLEVAYATVMVFVVHQPEGAFGPLMFSGAEVPPEEMAVRRLYAIEGWIAFGFLALYLGITEIAPRGRR